MQSIDERIQKYVPFFGTWELKDPPEVLGRGNSGKVYRIWNSAAGGMLDAAMKVIAIPRDDRQVQAWLKEAGGSEAGLRRRIQEEYEYVRAEIQTMESLKADSHIVCFEDYQIYERTDVPLGWDVLIRMERLVTLTDFLDNIGKYPHKRDMRLVMTIWDELLSGLCLCERNHVLHLDIKPENIFYAEPSKDYFKLGDFGVSIRNEKDKIAGKGTRVGTEDYMAPEMYNFQGSDSRSDMYSLAVVIYELLNGGRLPFMSASDRNSDEERRKARQRRLSGKEAIGPIKGVDGRLMQIILKCLAYNPDDRYPNMQQMQAALRAYIYGSADKPGKSAKAAGEKGKSKAPLFIGLGAAGVLAVLALLLTRGGGSKPPEGPTPTPTETVAETTAPPLEELPTPVPEPAVKVGSVLTEDAPRLVMESDHPLEVSLYYFKKGQQIELDNNFLVDRDEIDGRVTKNLLEMGCALEEGDVCVIAYTDAGEEGTVPVEVGPSIKLQMEMELEAAATVEGQEYSVVKSPYLSGYVYGDGGEYASIHWEVEGDSENGDTKIVEIGEDGKGYFQFYSDKSNVADRGSIIDVTASYASGLGLSRSCRTRVLWTSDEVVDLTWDTVMERDASIVFHAEPSTSIVLKKDGEPMGAPIVTGEGGVCEWKATATFKVEDNLTVSAEDAVGNVLEDREIHIQPYSAQLLNVKGGALYERTLSISGTARPGSILNVYFVDEDNETELIRDDVQASEESGAYSVQIDTSEIPGFGAEAVQCHLAIGNDADGRTMTEDFNWYAMAKLQLDQPLTEDSETLEVHTEPGLPVSIADLEGEIVLEDLADAEGVCRYSPVEGFTKGEVYTVTVVDPDYDSRTNTLEIQIQEAVRAKITVEVADIQPLADSETGFVKGPALHVSGTAEPGRDLLVRWQSETPIEETVTVSDEGTYDLELRADEHINDKGVTASVVVLYMDGKAASMNNKSSAVLWTTDDSVKVEIDPIMESSTAITVQTDADAHVAIRKGDVELAAGDADSRGRFSWDFQQAPRDGEVYAVDCEDRFGNQASAETEVLKFSIRVDGADTGVVKGGSIALAGVAQPETELSLILNLNGEDHVIAENLKTDDKGVYAAEFDAAALSESGIDVDGGKVRLSAQYGEERVETPSFTWSVSVPLLVTPEELTEESEALQVASEAGALVKITRIQDDTNEETEVFSGQPDEDGSYSYAPEGGFVSGASYRVTVEDPQDAARPGREALLSVQEARRADIRGSISPTSEVDGWDYALIKGDQAAFDVTAEPGQQIAVRAFDGDELIVEKTADVDANGEMHFSLDSGEVVNGDYRTVRFVLAYADGKAYSRRVESDNLIWTEDTDVPLEAGEVIEGDQALRVQTEAGARVTVSVNGQSINGDGEAADASGLYSFALDEPAQVGGAYDIQAVDAYGNAAQAQAIVAADAFAPVTIEVEPGDSVSASTRQLTVRGEAEPNAALLMHLNDAAIEITATGEGTYEWTEDVENIGALAEGDNRFQVSYAEGHVNRASGNVTVFADRTVPALDVDLVGVSSRTTEITGNTEVGATVALTINDNQRITVSGEEGFIFDGLELHDNDQLSLQAWDAAGNVSEIVQTTISRQEAAKINARVNGNKLYVSGWIVCDDPRDVYITAGNGKIRDDIQAAPVDAKDLMFELLDYENETGVHVNTEGKQCLSITEQEIKLDNLPVGTQTLELWMDGFPSEDRLLDSTEFVIETAASAVENIAVVDFVNSQFVVGLDDTQPMDSGSILVTGWVYGTSNANAYTISEAYVAKPKPVEEAGEGNDTRSADMKQIIVETGVEEDYLENCLVDNLVDDPQYGYTRLTRLDVASVCPAELRSQVGDIKEMETNAGFMILLDKWSGLLEDGEYKLVVGVQCGGRMYYPNASLTIRNGEPAIGSAQMRSIAEAWNPPPVEETEGEAEVQP